MPKVRRAVRRASCDGSAVSEAEFFAVIITTLRGRRVEIWMRDGEGPAEADVYSYNMYSRRLLDWTLTLDEVAALEDVLTAP